MFACDRIYTSSRLRKLCTDPAEGCFGLGHGIRWNSACVAIDRQKRKDPSRRGACTGTCRESIAGNPGSAFYIRDGQRMEKRLRRYQGGECSGVCRYCNLAGSGNDTNIGIAGSLGSGRAVPDTATKSIGGM